MDGRRKLSDTDVLAPESGGGVMVQQNSANVGLIVNDRRLRQGALVALTPNEARTLAALLLAHAARVEGRCPACSVVPSDALTHVGCYYA